MIEILQSKVETLPSQRLKSMKILCDLNPQNKCQKIELPPKKWTHFHIFWGGIYDNMKAAVDKVLKDKSRIVNARFSEIWAHYLFDPDFCNIASGWEKGVVEK